MRLILFSAIALLAFSASVAAQQQLLVKHDDKNDPCARFKMRILIPANVDDKILPARKFKGGIDAGMVWNHCGTSELEIADVWTNMPPNERNLLFSNSPVFVQSGTQQYRITPLLPGAKPEPIRSQP